MLSEPSYIDNAPKIQGNFGIHRSDRFINKKGLFYINFFTLSDDKNEFHTQ